MAAAGYPQPPDVVRQQAPPEQPPPQSVFSAQPGQSSGQPGQPGAGAEVAQQIQGKLQELDKWATDMKMMLDSYDKALSVFLQPIAQAGLQLTQAIQEKAQRSGGGGQSPVASPQGAAGPAAGVPRGV